MPAPNLRHRRLLAAVAVLAATASACSGPAKVCAPDKRKVILKAKVDDAIPSPPFTVPPGRTAWVRITKTSSNHGLFDTAGGIAQLFIIRDGAAPRVLVDERGFSSHLDPDVSIDKPFSWEPLPIDRGSWRLYAASVRSPEFEVALCPAPD